MKSRRVHLLATTTKEDSVSRQSSRSNRVGFTYELQRPKETASAVNPADQIGSGSLTSYNDQRRQRQPSIQQIYFNHNKYSSLTKGENQNSTLALLLSSNLITASAPLLIAYINGV